MYKNLGISDRLIRGILGLILFSLVFIGPKTDFGYIGLILIVTSVIRFCPLYRLIGMNTLKKD